MQFAAHPRERVMRFKQALFALIVGSAALTTSQAEAQSGFALNRFDPSERGSEWFMQDTLDLRGHLRPAAGIVGDYAFKPLVIYNTDGSERGAIVSHQITTNIGGSLVLWDRVR